MTAPPVRTGWRPSANASPVDMPSRRRVIKTSLLPISTCRIGASTSRFYSVLVDDARNITFDDTSRRRRVYRAQRRSPCTLEHSRCEGKRVPVFLPQKTKHQRSYDNTTAPAHLDSNQKKRDRGNELMFFLTALAVGYVRSPRLCWGPRVDPREQ